MRNRIRTILVFFVLVSLTASIALAQAAPDPMRIATGARPLGMGKAFVGLADDIGSVFLNPAGIGNPTRWQLTSMSGKLLEEFNYLSFSGIYPTDFGNLGIAYLGSSIGGALPTTIEAGSNPNDPIYIVDTSQDPMSYYNNLLILSYGTRLERLLNNFLLAPIGNSLPFLKDINFGLNLKIFSVNLTGDHISQGNAHGLDMDFGLQGKALPWLSIGATVQNALPFSLGGKLTYDSGWEESYPSVLKVGSAINILGAENALMQWGDNNLCLLTDVDYEIERSDTIPPLFHVGLEYKPLDLIAVRVGLDQEMVGVGQAVGNLTAGVGLFYGDFRFDYAYHQFAGAPGVDNHFFSLSYGIAPVFTREMLAASPDKLITTQMVITVNGVAVDPTITSIKVNGVKTKLTPRGEYINDVALNIGKNVIKIEAFDDGGKLVASRRLRILRLVTYPDIPKVYWASEQIGYIGTLGIIKGYPDGNFKADGNITRAESAALLVRTAVGGDEKVPASKQQIFNDVPFRHWAVNYINYASDNGTVKGYPDKTFRPSANITRAEGLAMIARFGGVGEQSFREGLFPDVTDKNWAAPIITGAYNEGLLIHFKDKPFEPNKSLTRAETVELLFRSRPVVNLVNKLKDFDSY